MRILYELCNVVMRINAQLPPDKQRSVDIAANMAAVSTTKDTSRELENLQSQLLKLCAEIKSARINRRRRSADQLLKYVQEHYNDPNLSLKSIGAVFEMNEIYVSSCFKQSTGINFLEYLQKIRLTKALEFLQTTNLTITETAVKVGYANDQTFRRAFKRAYGVSPTSYMESVISSQEEQKTDNSKEEKEHL